MSGLVSPKSIGLTDIKSLDGMMKEFKLLFNLFELIVNRIVPASNLFGFLLTYIFSYSAKEIMIYGIPHSIIHAIALKNMYSLTLWQFLYFYMTCRYLKNKIQVLNRQLKAMKKYKSRNLFPILKSFVLIEAEISQYNNNIWSKFLLLIWILFIPLFNLLIYFSAFAEMNFVIRFTLISLSVLLVIVFVIIVNAASNVKVETDKTYHLFNSNLITTTKQKSKFNPIKVCFTSLPLDYFI